MQFYRNIKSSKISCRQLIDKISFHNFVRLGFAIGDYNKWPKLKKGGGVNKWGWGFISLSRKINTNPGKLSPLSRICLEKLWHVCIKITFILLSANVLNLDKSKILSFIMSLLFTYHTIRTFNDPQKEAF